jgi:hypothetical protein
MILSFPAATARHSKEHNDEEDPPVPVKKKERQYYININK